MPSDTSTELEKSALERKARLVELKRKQLKGQEIDHRELQEGDEEDESEEKRMRFRNYDPHAEQLQESKEDKIQPSDVTSQIADHLKLTKDVSVVEEIDIANLEPRKVDWDLKRDISKKLEKLEKRTKRALAELIRERLAEGKINDMDAVVNQGASAAQDDVDDE